ncbi:syntaxin-binding protein 4 isoform X2 [Phycodurus eques]|uniref:syntaxin-binding protein 4 isoform X2 n=1 Tax=Phycodurus eques TaxID=693459 RepID=UPI002ACD389A|nr:syntaxin-binding protein 4 isoform X2 [Phycodurus eques]
MPEDALQTQPRSHLCAISVCVDILSMQQEAECVDGLPLLYWTIMSPRGVTRAVRRLEFRNCERGLGVKIIGGYREMTGEDFGIFVKRVVAGGLAALDGRLKSGDLIVDVNDISLRGVTNERAVELLRMASLSNHMSLLVARDDDSRREFSELMEKYGCAPLAASGRVSPTQQSAGETRAEAQVRTSALVTQVPILRPDAESPRLLGPKEGVPVYGRAATPAFSDSVIQLICIAKGSGLGLGLVVVGGANRAQGPTVFIQDIVAGGDCQKDGRLQVGDQLVSVNKESLIGVTHEEAKTILTRTKLRPDPTVEVAFIRRRTSSGSGGGPHGPVDGGARGEPPPPPPVLVAELASSRTPASETLPAVDVSQVSPVFSHQRACVSSSPEPDADTDGGSCRLKLEQVEKSTSGCDDVDEMERLRKENVEALREIKRLQDRLSESRRVQQQMEEELDDVKLEAKAAAEETRALRARVLLVEEARKQARGMEMDYEEVVHLLEAEIAELKTHRAKQPRHPPPPPPLLDNKEDSERLKEKAAVLECQLRKSDAAKKTLEMSTTKLLAFVQNVEEFLLEGLGPTKSLSCVDAEGVSQGGPSRHKKSSWTAAALAKQANELSASVRNVLEVDGLCFG